MIGEVGKETPKKRNGFYVFVWLYTWQFRISKFDEFFKMKQAGIFWLIIAESIHSTLAETRTILKSRWIQVKFKVFEKYYFKFNSYVIDTKYHQW